MTAWDVYRDRLNVSGSTRREAALIREARRINRRVPDSLSYHSAAIYDAEHGYNVSPDETAEAAFLRNVSIINSDNLNEKTILSMPGEDLEHGSLVHWMDNYWLITERDANTTLYTRAKMIQCNYLLRWIGNDDEIYEQWCIIEDGTKYLTGEFEDRYLVSTRGDSRIAMTIARNDITVKMGRDMRFLIDDPASNHMLAYTLTKPLKLGGSFNDKGVFKFVLQEVVQTDNDNQELRIADYYKHFPNPDQDDDVGDDATSGGSDAGASTERRSWL